MIFCPTVSTGAFVARRNGKVFLTGNSGFPKSLDVSKAIDKAAGVEREAAGANPNHRPNSHMTVNSWREAEGRGASPMSSPVLTAPATEAAKQWEGWGTALKPAFEPVIVARKPLVGTVAANVQQHGTGAINIDGCRVATDDTYSYPNGAGGNTFTVAGEVDGTHTTPVESSPLGRWPANLIHDGSDEVVALFPDAKGQIATTGKRSQGDVYGVVSQDGEGIDPRNDTGSAARFFYCAKTSKKDRNEGMDTIPNRHPTVKPTELMRYLCRLVTPPGGTVLDPFMGSGSTGKAALKEGFGFVGIDSDEEHGYFDIALARIKSAVK